MIRTLSNVKSQGTEETKLFSQGTDDSQNLRHETLAAADYDYVDISSFTVLDIKFRMRKKMIIYTQITFEIQSNSFIRRLKTYTNVYLAITSYPTQQTWKFLHIRNQQ